MTPVKIECYLTKHALVIPPKKGESVYNRYTSENRKEVWLHWS